MDLTWILSTSVCLSTVALILKICTWTTIIYVTTSRTHHVITRCVCETSTSMPQAATKSKSVLNLDSAPPPGACDVSEVSTTLR